MKNPRPVITLEPPVWRCENGTEFQCGANRPPRCPVCGSTKIEMVVEVEPQFSQRTKEQQSQ